MILELSKCRAIGSTRDHRQALEDILPSTGPGGGRTRRHEGEGSPSSRLSHGQAGCRPSLNTVGRPSDDLAGRRAVAAGHQDQVLPGREPGRGTLKPP